MFKKQEPQLQFPVETIIRNFLFTTSQDVWVGYKLVPQGFPLNDLEFFEKYIEDGKGMFEHDQYEYHLVNIPNYFDIEEHIEQTIKETVKGDFSDLGEIYFRQAGKILKDEVQIAGMAIMEVIMKFTYVFSTNKEEDAAIIFDEAKGFEDTAQGQSIKS
ncbi:Uncharacterised protein [Enterococcus hirae]|nr:Uncharacterised protein [Enterococcus hirae]